VPPLNFRTSKLEVLHTMILSSMSSREGTGLPGHLISLRQAQKLKPYPDAVICQVESQHRNRYQRLFALKTKGRRRKKSRSAKA